MTISARVMETKVSALATGIGRVVRLVLNVPDADVWRTYQNAGTELLLDGDLKSPTPLWVENAYQVPFDHTSDLRLLLACPEQEASKFQQASCRLAAGDTIRLGEPIAYPFPNPINSRGKLVMLAAGCGVEVFLPLAKKIYSRDIDWMGEVRIYTGDVTGVDRLYLNRKNQDLMNYLDDTGFRAFNALMARSSPMETRLMDIPQDTAVLEFVHMVRSPSVYVYVAGDKTVVEHLGVAVDRQVGKGTWMRILDELRIQNHWYDYFDYKEKS